MWYNDHDEKIMTIIPLQNPQNFETWVPFSFTTLHQWDIVVHVEDHIRGGRTLLIPLASSTTFLESLFFGIFVVYTTFSSLKPAMRWYSSAFRIRSTITCLIIPENALCLDMKLLYWCMAFHLSLRRLTMPIKAVSNAWICSMRKVESRSHHIHQLGLRLSPSHYHQLTNCYQVSLHKLSCLRSSSNTFIPPW